MMAGQQAAFRAHAMGGYDSDVEGGGGGYANDMGAAFADKEVSL